MMDVKLVERNFNYIASLNFNNVDSLDMNVNVPFKTRRIRFKPILAVHNSTAIQACAIRSSLVSDNVVGVWQTRDSNAGLIRPLLIYDGYEYLLPEPIDVKGLFRFTVYDVVDLQAAVPITANLLLSIEFSNI
jgi:hypothetical protein